MGKVIITTSLSLGLWLLLGLASAGCSDEPSSVPESSTSAISDNNDDRGNLEIGDAQGTRTSSTTENPTGGDSDENDDADDDDDDTPYDYGSTSAGDDDPEAAGESDEQGNETDPAPDAPPAVNECDRFHNANNPADTNGDGVLSTIDTLIVTNYLFNNGDQTVPADPDATIPNVAYDAPNDVLSGPRLLAPLSDRIHYLDVTGDCVIDAADRSAAGPP